MGNQSKIKEARRRDRAAAEARDPLGAVSRYADALTVFGQEITPSEVIDRIKSFDWRNSFVRLAHLAAAVARDPAGPKSASMQRWARNALEALNGSSTRHIAHAKAWAKSGDDAVVVHEEALDYLQHLVLLYGAEDGEVPGDSELVLWLLGAAQLMGGWEIEDGSDVTMTEALIAEQVRVARFNNREDPLNLLVRAADMFGSPPFAGKLSNRDTWNAIERAAFGRPFAEHFETRILPWFSHSMRWGKSEAELPVLEPESWVKNTGAAGKPIVEWLFSQSRTRDELAALIRAPMKGAAVPRAPTILLHHPMVRLSDERIAIASPWRILAHLRTGIWFAFMEGTKAVLGKNAGQDWTAAFGYMFEEWLRAVARHAVTPSFKGRLLLSEHPGSPDEIDDIVVLEGNTVILFSAKARLVEKSVARDAKSKRMVIDWYQKFLFAEEQGAFRVGAVRQFDAGIQRIRSGAFPEVPRNCRIVPVLVTYDTLCEEFLLYQWIGEQCRALGLLQQDGVAPLVIAHVNDFERLLGRASRGLSLAGFFKARDGDWKGRRLQNQIGVTRPHDRLPQLETRFVELMNSMSTRLLGKPMSSEKIRRVTSKQR
jgi:hypothetical protein